MKCPECGFENREEAKFCGNCGKALLLEIEPKWRWGSMIASLVLLQIYYYLVLSERYYYYSGMSELEKIVLLFGVPVTIYLMYKERIVNIKYGLAWILFPILIFNIGWFLTLVIPAIAIDSIYVIRGFSTIYTLWSDLTNRIKGI
jgi:hypothetical protein